MRPCSSIRPGFLSVSTQMRAKLSADARPRAQCRLPAGRR
jgi:hypothetical protein